MFTQDKFVTGQSIDMKDVLIQTTPILTPFTTLLLPKTVKAENATLNWIEEAINENAVVTMGEGGDAPSPVDDTLTPKSNYCQLVGATATVSNTAQYTNAKGISDLLAHEVVKKTKAMKIGMENILINGTKGYTSATKTYTTDGILAQINAANQVTNTTFTKAKFEEVVGKMYDAGVNDEMLCFIPASMKITLNGFNNVEFLARDMFLGFDTERYVTPYGIVTFVLSEKLNNKLFVVNPNYLELAELIPFHATPQPVSGSKQSIYLETQFGLKLLNSKAGASFAITA
ncbi:hypothetical protein SDC9_15175 [bioreactor metagenome]|uniref:Phage major capsid protein n=1 Tax=bioreactor metagenome TaxID=1076179 RepID=A0A644TR68_9ZZZZ|nr:DUF5309 domain-containing protein [Desulfitobacterium hafniense]MEA5023927.1 DUF5309 domain-containing protein [Desulfitobacterium hafniense]